MSGLTFTKHHGLGNDFLVLVDLAERHPVGAALAAAVCDRRRGAGADGVIRVTPGTGGADVTMELRNADGSVAEMSGNGIRCLAQAVAMAGAAPGPELAVATAAGRRTTVLRRRDDRGCALVGVDMGPARLVEQAHACNVSNARQAVDVGNPHLVLLGPDPATVAVGVLGAELDAAAPAGTNVEFVALGPGRDELTMRVWERGVGETLACGTGACAAAAAAHAWGLAGARVVVHQPGGDAEVELRGDTVVLTGPAQYVCTVVWPEGEAA